MPYVYPLCSVQSPTFLGAKYIPKITMSPKRITLLKCRNTPYLLRFPANKGIPKRYALYLPLVETWSFMVVFG